MTAVPPHDIATKSVSIRFSSLLLFIVSRHPYIGFALFALIVIPMVAQPVFLLLAYARFLLGCAQYGWRTRLQPDPDIAPGLRRFYHVSSRPGWRFDPEANSRLGILGFGLYVWSNRRAAETYWGVLGRKAYVYAMDIPIAALSTLRSAKDSSRFSARFLVRPHLCLALIVACIVSWFAPAQKQALLLQFLSKHILSVVYGSMDYVTTPNILFPFNETVFAQSAATHRILCSAQIVPLEPLHLHPHISTNPDNRNGTPQHNHGDKGARQDRV